MPHLVLLHSPGLEAECDFAVLTRQLADTLLAARDDAGQRVFPVGGVRVLCFRADHAAVAEPMADPAAAAGHVEAGFIYFQLRMARGRSAAVQRSVGEALVATARELLAPLLARRALGLTLQIDEGHEVFDAKFGNLHALFAPTGAALPSPPATAAATPPA